MTNHVPPTEAELNELETNWNQLREFSDKPMPERLIFQAKWREIARDLMGSIAHPLLPKLIDEAREAARLRIEIELARRIGLVVEDEAK